MPGNPGLDLEHLGEALRRAYALPIIQVEYLPVGMVGRHYRAVASTGEGYFITVYDDARLARIAASKLGFTLPLTYRLYESGLFQNLVPPLKTIHGALQAEFNGWPLLVYPFLEGHILDNELPLSGETQFELAGIVARLHLATALAWGMPHLICEQFNFPFEAPLRQGLGALHHLSPGDRYGRLALRDLLLPRQGNILGMLDHLHALAEPLRQMPPPFVICHTDIHTGNVLRNREGSLIVLDWEGVCLAPAEYDLFIFTGEGFEAFLQAYYHMGGGRNLTASTFAYYLYRRNLEDLADFIVRILDENTDLQTDQSDLEGVNALLADWPGLEKAEQRLRLILSEV